MRLLSMLGVNAMHCEAHLLLLGGELGLALLEHREGDSLGLGQRDGRLGAVSDDEHVADTSGESVSSAILEVCDIERTGVLLDGDDGSDAADVGSASDHGQLADVELEVADGATGRDVELDGVEDFLQLQLQR